MLRMTTKTSAATTGPVFAANPTAFVQSYTLNQNGTSAGINVSGVINGTSKSATSTINATINLNSGSITLGSITAQQSPGQFGSNATFLTTTTVNLNGAGFLGLDFQTCLTGNWAGFKSVMYRVDSTFAG